ncbi:retron system putative HNH endonuclease [uncultured Faecalibaculum sp.]|uniref:retron system putative HNH endonuclease n=1 Tax=uncultured Faecalibaculum sp. TaxID=1729681 RepID=UPI0025ED9050|nr:retron system putative HNH endonuclease [uncultured Faecalibaculum sp.]
MIYIHKKQTPDFLRKCQSDPQITFKTMHGSDKQNLRHSLCEEQNELCAYCMKRIRPVESGMKVEHFDPQSHEAGNDLDYNNLLAVCDGKISSGFSGSTCDTHKGDRTLYISPLNPDVESMVHYQANGIIIASEKLPEEIQSQVDADLNDILNLNHVWLQRNRKAVLEAYKLQIAKHGRGKGKLPESFWKSEEAKYRLGSRRNQEYKGIILDYIAIKRKRAKS